MAVFSLEPVVKILPLEITIVNVSLRIQVDSVSANVFYSIIDFKVKKFTALSNLDDYSSYFLNKISFTHRTDQF